MEKNSCTQVFFFNLRYKLMHTERRNYALFTALFSFKNFLEFFLKKKKLKIYGKLKIFVFP